MTPPVRLKVGTSVATSRAIEDCPFCESDMVANGDYETPEVEENNVIQVVSCKNCGARWHEVYTLARYVVADLPEKGNPNE